jgi:hypothetical protein
MRYWILDKDETSQTFPLQRLVRRVAVVIGAHEAKWFVRKARGYGRQIRTWEEALNERDTLPVAFDVLDDLSQGTSEWFYDL